MSVLEAVAWVAERPWSNKPECVSPVIATFMRRWGCNLWDEERKILVPLIPRVVDTGPTRARIEKKRAWMAADWMIRVQAPAWLELAGIADCAATLRGLPEVTAASVQTAQPSINEAQERAAGRLSASQAKRRDRSALPWVRARNALQNTAGDAAGYAARPAAEDAPRDALGDAAWNSAYVASLDAACSAAHLAEASTAPGTVGDQDAVRAAFEPTEKRLQDSALELVERMITIADS